MNRTDGPQRVRAPLRVDTVLRDRYRILELLGEGPFVYTYLATDGELDRCVALKEYCPTQFAHRRAETDAVDVIGHYAREYEAGRQLFEREAKALAKIDHPAVVKVMNVWDALGTTYMVVEYVEGRALGLELNLQGGDGGIAEIGGPDGRTLVTTMSQGRVREILLALVDGLEKVHCAGIVHGSIGPSNVMLRVDGTPVIVDFANCMLDSPGARPVFLYPGYSPLEMYGDGRNLGPWTDIYSLAATAYTALTGQRPTEAVERLAGRCLPAVAQAAKEPLAKSFGRAIDWALAVDFRERPRDLWQWTEALRGNGGAVPFCALGSDGDARVFWRPGVVQERRDDRAGRAWQPGTVLAGQYQILKLLGAGGFGKTYLAFDKRLECLVAVKEFFPVQLATRRPDGTVAAVTSSGAAKYEIWLRRFRREARTLARFSHPQIVGVVDVFDAFGTAYMVMRYIEGQSLAQELNLGSGDGKTSGTRPFRPARVRELLVALVDGLQKVHAEGLLHRDIKPSNVMLQQDGSWVLIDFGAAVDVTVGPGGAVQSEGYSAIEQYSDTISNQGPWTDVYGLAATGYVALIGERLRSAPERMMVEAEGPTAQTKAADGCRGLAAALDAGLAVAPGDRPQDLRQWRELL